MSSVTFPPIFQAGVRASIMIIDDYPFVKRKIMIADDFSEKKFLHIAG